jgi:hypothetical protein
MTMPSNINNKLIGATDNLIELFTSVQRLEKWVFMAAYVVDFNVK